MDRPNPLEPRPARPQSPRAERCGAISLCAHICNDIYIYIYIYIYICVAGCPKESPVGLFRWFVFSWTLRAPATHAPRRLLCGIQPLAAVHDHDAVPASPSRATQPFAGLFGWLTSQSRNARSFHAYARAPDGRAPGLIAWIVKLEQAFLT
jgi:hypothetical protein